MTIGKWTKENFARFDEENPHVWELFERYALQAASRRKRFSARAVFHRMRWASMMEGDKPFKIDNSWSSHYARKFVQEHPQYEGFFETRLQKNSYHDDGTPVQYCPGCNNLLVQAYAYKCPKCDGAKLI